MVAVRVLAQADGVVDPLDALEVRLFAWTPDDLDSARVSRERLLKEHPDVGVERRSRDRLSSGGIARRRETLQDGPSRYRHDTLDPVRERTVTRPLVLTARRGSGYCVDVRRRHDRPRRAAEVRVQPRPARCRPVGSW